MEDVLPAVREAIKHRRWERGALDPGSSVADQPAIGEEATHKTFRTKQQRLGWRAKLSTAAIEVADVEPIAAGRNKHPSHLAADCPKVRHPVVDVALCPKLVG